LRDYRDLEGISGTYLAVARVHARKGQACLSCSGEIRYGSVAGRGTYWCPLCQKKQRARSGKSSSRAVKR
jgi:formamidopyrimidine-DNA glycosylase